MYIISLEDTTIDPFRPFFRLTLFFPFNLPLPELTHTTLQHFTCLHAFQLPRQLGTCAHGPAIHLGLIFLLPHFCLPQSYLG